MEQWEHVEKWGTDDEVAGWLKLQGLDNSQAIIAKVIEKGAITYAHGTRRLRYEKGKFYLDKYIEDRTDYGVGKHIDIQALEKRFQSLYPAAQIMVQFNKHPNAMALSMYISDKVDGRRGYRIQINPAKLTRPNQVIEKIRMVESELTS